MMRVLAVVLLLLALAGCNDSPAGSAPSEDGGRTSVAGSDNRTFAPHRFESDGQRTGMVVDPDGIVNTVVTTCCGRVPEGGILVLNVTVTFDPPAALPLRVCLGVQGQPVAVLPCAEGTSSPLVIQWSNATAGAKPLGGGYRELVYFSPGGPQVIGDLKEHVDGVVLSE
jgi:hypothetical protein